MAKLVYWHAGNIVGIDNTDDVIAKTKRGAQEQMEKLPATNYLPIKKCVIVYKDAFDLMEKLTAIGGGRGYFNA